MNVATRVKGWFTKCVNFLSSANDKIEDVQDTIDEIVDNVQEEVEEVKSMLGKATDEEK